MTDKTLLILNGPGLRDPSVHGDVYENITLQEIRHECSALCDELGMGLEFRQTEDQDEMFRWIASDSEHFDALLINPVGPAGTDTVDFDSYRAAFDKIAHLEKPVIEVRLTNIFRQGAKPLRGPEGEMGLVCGLSFHGYLLGIKAVAKSLQG